MDKDELLFCAGCGRKLKYEVALGSLWIKCPQRHSLRTFLFGGMDEHTMEIVQLYYKPEPKYDTKTGERLGL